LSIDLSDNTELLLQAYYEKLSGAASDGFVYGIDAAGNLFLPRPDYRNNYGSELNDTDSSVKFAFANLEHRFSEVWSLTAKAAYSDLQLDNKGGYLSGFADENGDVPISEENFTGFFTFNEKKDKTDLSVDVALTRKFTVFDRDSQFVVSTDWRRQREFSPSAGFGLAGTLNVFEGGPLLNPIPIIPIEGEFSRREQEFWGVTALVHFELIEKLAVLVGDRYSVAETSFTEFFPSDDFVVQVEDKEDNEWIPRLGVVYSLSGQHNLYFSYSKGVVFNQTLFDGDGQSLEPEQGVQYEVGLKGELAARHSASVFSTYEVLEGKLRTLTVGGGAVYRSETEVDPYGSAQLPSFTRFDLRASYDFTEQLLLELNVQNIFNEEIFTSSYGFPDLGIRYLDAREVSLRATYKW
jgi:outer-membrane receptor for ferric coprogen and ferric-rhodotorulic acid